MKLAERPKDLYFLLVAGGEVSKGDKKPRIPVEDYNPLWTKLLTHPGARKAPALAAGHQGTQKEQFDFLEPDTIRIFTEQCGDVVFTGLTPPHQYSDV